MDGLIAELIALKPDVIYAPTTAAALAAQRATRTIPIVFSLAADPLGDRLVDNLARPSGNVTGFSNISRDLMGKRVETLADCVPKLSRMVVLTNPTLSYNIRGLEDVRATASQLGIAVKSIDIARELQFESAFEELARERPGAMLVNDNPLFTRHRVAFVERIGKLRIPAIYGISEFVVAGGLVSFGPNYADLMYRAGGYVDRILRGTKPADLPVQLPTTFELAINLKTANTLGLTIPKSILVRANKVIE